MSTSKDILYLNTSLQFKTVNKDSLFYGKFEYAVTFHLEEITALRELDHAWIDTMIARRRAWREISLQRWASTIKHFNKQVLSRVDRPEITDEVLANLHRLADELLATKSEFKLVTSGNSGWVYSNDRGLVKHIGQLTFLNDVAYTQAVVNRPKNTIQLANPKHQYRSYLKSIKLSEAQKTNLEQFFKSQHDVRVSPSFSNFFSGSFTRTMDYYFIDHDSEQLLTMVSLISPGLIRKTQTIITK